MSADGSKVAAHMDQFHDTSPKRAVRSADLPLYHPPQVKIEAQREGEQLIVTLCGYRTGMTTRWESDGQVSGEGGQVRWTPGSEQDQLRVAVRSKGGIAVVSLRAADLA